MSCKLISYDLDKPNRNYEELYEKIKSLGSWWHCLESVWIVDTAKNTAEIRDALTSVLDSGDKIAVFHLSKGWATKNLDKDCNNWLKEHI